MSKRKLLIVSGESSGELYGALLAKELNQDFELFGIGGKKMAQAGVELIGEITHALGFVEVLGKLSKIKETYRVARDFLKQVDGVVLIDFPDFNLRLAKVAKELKKRVLYYVCPQVWAWRKGRLKEIRECVDLLAVILPFEEALLTKEGVRAKFVGHPIAELLMEELGVKFNSDFSPFELKAKLRENFPVKDKVIIALMPGSRPAELKRHCKIIEKVVASFDSRVFHFIIPIAPNLESEIILRETFSSLRNVTFFHEKSFTALAMADVALIKSGTSTLQATFLQVPFLVIYRVNYLSYLIAKSLVRGVRHIALPNVVADFLEIDGFRIPEFVQHLDEERILSELNRVVTDQNYRQKFVDFEGKVSSYFLSKEPSKEVSKLCRELFF